MNHNRLFKLLIGILIILFLTINVVDKDNSIVWEEAFNDNAKVIYLTFDDGPSTKVTNRILDTLKQKDIKATFFIVGYKIKDREDILIRINKEGHSIGLHSYTHDLKKIYASTDAFIDEMDRTFDEIKNLTGVEAHAIRFPGGSKNRLNSEMLQKLNEKNYKVYDWNASLSDGINFKTSPDKLFVESTKIVGRFSRIILLMHCDAQNENTCKALPRIIDYYKNMGYEFKAIDSDTPQFYFSFNK